MQSSTAPTREVLAPSGVGRTSSAENERRLFAFIGLGVVAVGVIVGAAPRMPSPSLRGAMGEATVLVATITAWAVLRTVGRRPDAWSGTRLAAGANDGKGCGGADRPP